MPTHVAFLRAINVTGRFVKMEALAAAFHALGHADARTFINSGNVVFSTRARSVGKLAAALEDGLEPLLGFRTEAFVRSAAEVQAIAARAAALKADVPREGEVNVAFLPQPASAEQAALVQALATPADRFVVEGAQVYWLCVTRQSDSRFSNALLERRLRVASTLRRASMLEALAAQL